MIQSMTGYGKSLTELSHKTIRVELKSLNSKNLDVNLRMSSQYRELEMPLRNLISEHLYRGKVDVSLHVESKTGETSAEINTKAVQAYIQQLKSISTEDDQLSFKDLLPIAVNLPEALVNEKKELNPAEVEAIKETLKNAIEHLIQHRNDEGKALEQDFNLRISNLKSLITEVKAIDPDRIDKVRERLHKAVADLKVDVDQNRFEQELMYYLEKYDITEEKTRLDNHLDYFLKTMNSAESNGKKLNFICQEIGREINTIGSKSNFAPMQKLVVKMKDELEKVKEQLLNVL
ncbi:YicC/YloC family endoribonuclease [Psychroflexus sp. ALD_RP9]|uniref:YicC/YloC family endoribonuclease n=1 Tax=Psychroflexus sp. ALD_RP9 TaxID=2777186 RepID=UPI001A8C79DC|nr:YicC/YloC family endoribonuclease [Psychroflexus sp. ALD_RP9]QSS97896.1 YicC family protein [Psychroflexus sp. ALD_RP9]